MKTIYRIIGILVLALIVQTSSAQFLTPHALYTQNRIMINPANTGDVGQAFLDYRNQWNVAQSPVSYLFGIQSPVGAKKNMGLGLVLQRDQYGVFRRTTGRLNYSYDVKLNDKNDLVFGVGAGFNDNRISRNDIINGGEAIAEGIAELGANIDDYKGVRFGASVGVKYNWNKKFEIGFAMPELFEDASYDVKKNFLGMVSYKFYAMKEKIEIEPSVVFRSYTKGDYSTTLFDANLYACWNQTLWMQGTFRASEPGIIIAAGVNFYNFGVGYGYYFQMDDAAKTFGSTHEIIVNYYFDKERQKNLNEELLNNEQLEMLMTDSTDVNEDDYQNQIDSLRKEIETLKMLLQVKDLKDWADGFKDKIDEYNDRINQLDPAKMENFGIHILFDEGQSDLKEKYYADLDNLAKLIKEGNLKVEVVGHANSNGGREFNQKLSEKRSNVVGEYLISKGAPANNLIFVGYGEDKPIADNNTTTGRAMNRRVQFRVQE